MKKYKLFSVIIVALLSTFLLLSGCSSATGGDTGGDTPPADGGGDNGGGDNGGGDNTGTYKEADFIGKWVEDDAPATYIELREKGEGSSELGEITWTLDSKEKEINVVFPKKKTIYTILDDNGKITLKHPFSYIYRLSTGDDDPTTQPPKEYPPKYNAPTAECNTYIVNNNHVKAIDISWKDSSPAGNKVVATAYHLYRANSSKGSDVGTRLYNAGKSELTYQDSDIEIGKTYYYYIIVRSKDGDGPASDRVSVKCE